MLTGWNSARKRSPVLQRRWDSKVGELNMARNAWGRVAVPILTLFGEHESHPRDWSVGSIADQLALEPQEVFNELKRLKADGYIQFSKYSPGGMSLKNTAIREIEL